MNIFLLYFIMSKMMVDFIYKIFNGNKSIFEIYYFFVCYFDKIRFQILFDIY